jgi:hypothetical protein
MSLLCCLLASAGRGESRLHLKAGERDQTPGVGAATVMKRNSPGRIHLLVLFREVPGAAQIESLRQRGVAVVSYVPDTGLIVSAPDSFVFEDFEVVEAAPLRPARKLSPAIYPPQAGEPAEMALLAPEFFLVEAHGDVEPEQVRALAGEEGFEVFEHPVLLPHHALVRGPAARLAALARWDEVAYVFPASWELVLGLPLAACAGAVTAQGPVGQPAASVGEGWDGAGLGSATLGYFFERLTAKLPPDATRSEILRAMQEWTRYAAISFFPSAAAAAPRSLNVLFGAGFHGDAYPFDGPSRVLAHTYYPAPPNPEPIAGDMHFDDDEEWVIGPNVTIRSIDLFSVALHETGHALGLAHSDVPGSVMYPYYRRATGLTADDIAGIQRLYAAPGTTPLVLAIANPPLFPMTTTAATVDMSGTVTGGSGEVTVRWSTDRGYAGSAAGGRSWVISALPLNAGGNTVTITATDAGARQASMTVFVTRQDIAQPPVVRILSPTSNSSYVSTSGSVTVSGTAAHPSGIARVEWTNSRGGSGAALGTTSWTTGPIALQSGVNDLRVTGFDAAGGSAAAMLAVTYNPPPVQDTVAPSLKIVSPSSTNVQTKNSTILLAGTATDNVGVTLVSWRSSLGASGEAQGTGSWSAQVPLLVGVNTVVVRAYDAAGNSAWRSVTVTRR